MNLPVNIHLRRPALTGFGRAAAAEWLVTNGVGGYAAGTVAMACTRRYHGLLVASLAPPVARTVLVAKCDITVDYRGQRYALGANEYLDGTLDPQGFCFLDAFALHGAIPQWTWRMADLELRMRIWMPQGAQTAHLALSVQAAGAPVGITLHPLCTCRDYHALARAGSPFEIAAEPGGCRVTPWPGAPSYRLLADAAMFEAAPAWHYRVLHRVERERGLDDHGDLFHPGTFHAQIAQGDALTLTCTLEEGEVEPTRSLRDEARRQQALLTSLPARLPGWVSQLVLAADQFIVRRGASGTTLLAGYPWFTDWGRDTMIALPGIVLATGRVEEARRILETYAAHVSEGMLPNRFPDDGGAPEYNTADASLWFFHAFAQCLAAEDDAVFAQRMYPVLCDIVAWHVRGTRHGIGVDPGDELLRAGAPGLQLTWMDARVGTHVVTPRHGKPVEINALWQRALRVLASLAARCGDAAEARRLTARAVRHAASFRRRFWSARGWLFDVVDTPAGNDDATLRPNQLLAVALSPDLLTADQARAVVDRCHEVLWTPCGVRTLAPTAPSYRGTYAGDGPTRDAAYHQGTAWAWLAGPLARAHFAVYGDAARALTLLEPLSAHLAEGALGTLGEIFDGDAPHLPRGCFAQAWSVGCVLEAWFEIAQLHPSTAAREVTA